MNRNVLRKEDRDRSLALRVLNKYTCTQACINRANYANVEEI